MTKYSINPELAVPEKQGPKKTVFNRFVNCDAIILEPTKQPHDFERVELLWRDILYGDVFAAWNGKGKNRTIYFGEAGDEFGPLPPKP